MLSIVVVCFLAQLFFMLFFYLRVSIHKNNQDKKMQEKTSLIICARNEKENLEQHLESFLKQDYNDFELIVVNDRSWDNSIEFLNNMALKYPKLRVLDIPDNQTDHFGKKLNVLLNLFFNSTPSRIGRLRGGASCSTFIAAKEGPDAS